MLVQLLIEAVILAIGGAFLALPVAYLVAMSIVSRLPNSELALEFHWDLIFLGFVAAASVVCTLLFAVMPACRATGADLLARGLRASATATRSQSTQRLQRILIAAQSCLSVVVLIGTGLFLQTLVNLTRARPGFDSSHLLQLLVDPEGSGYGVDQIGGLYQRLAERLEAIPGVEAVSGVRNPILRGRLSGWNDVEQVEIGPAFFETMRIPLVRGRYLKGLDHTLVGFEALSIGGGQTVLLPNRVVISESLAKRLFGSGDPIGQRLPEPLSQRPTIVGVVKDARFSTLRADPRPPIYVSQGPAPNRLGSLLLRTSVDPSALATAVRQETWREHPRLVVDLHRVRDAMDRSIARERLVAALSSLFGILGTVLVCAGVFGAATYTVATRIKEFGVRVALGAKRWDVVVEGLRGTLGAFAAGVTAGIALALAGMRLISAAMSDMLYGLAPTDTLNIAGAVGVMLTAAFVASLLPAYRAAVVDPAAAIRTD